MQAEEILLPAAGGSPQMAGDVVVRWEEAVACTMLMGAVKGEHAHSSTCLHCCWRASLAPLEAAQLGACACSGDDIHNWAFAVAAGSMCRDAGTSPLQLVQTLPFWTMHSPDRQEGQVRAQSSPLHCCRSTQ